LNGLCTNKVCVCDAGWTTLPHGVNNAMAPGCGYLVQYMTLLLL
jgi:hypothetical protein